MGFTDGTKLCGAVNMLEGRDAIQGLSRRTSTGLRGEPVQTHEVQQKKCKVLHLAHLQVGRELIEGSPVEKDWGCWLMKTSS